MRIEYEILKQDKTLGEDAKQKQTVLFIDYEYLYWSFIRQYSVSPVLYSIIDNLRENGKIHKIKVFGDFSKPGIGQEREKIRTITNEIIDCSNGQTQTEKEYTDFIMLDQIYREAIQNPFIEQYILLTGDGHFSSVITFLKMSMDKTVGILGVKGTFNKQLCDCSSWAKILQVHDVGVEEYQKKLIRNFEVAKEKNIILTFLKTVQHVSELYGGEETKYQDVLSDMIENGYVSTEMTSPTAQSPSFRMLVPQWEKLNNLKKTLYLGK